MKRLCVALCALLLGAGCDCACVRGTGDEFWKGLWPDDVQMKKYSPEAKETGGAPAPAKPPQQGGQ
jgi:hypothetical protein